MYSPRFDAALLSLFTIEELAEPFTIKAMGGDWYILRNDAYGREQPVGRVRFSEASGMYISERAEWVHSAKKE